MQPRDDSDRHLRQRQLLELLRRLADRFRGHSRNLRSPRDDDSPYAGSSDHQRIVDEARQSSISFDQTWKE